MFKNLHSKLDRLYALVLAGNREKEGKNDLIALLKEENAELREQVKALMDRFMARNFEQLKLYSNGSIEVPDFEPINPFSDEDLSGMIINDEADNAAQ